jgi:hypothetical protein
MRNPEISQSAKAVYALLTTYANAEGICYAGIDLLASNLDISKRSVIRQISELEYVRVVERMGPERTRKYRLVTLSEITFTGAIGDTGVTEIDEESMPIGDTSVTKTGESGGIGDMDVTGQEFGDTDGTDPAIGDTSVHRSVTLVSPLSVGEEQEYKGRGVTRARQGTGFTSENFEVDPFNPAHGLPTLEAFLEYAEVHSVPKDVAETVFYSYSAAGWMNSKGVPIVHWGHALINAYRYRKDRDRQSGNDRSTSANQANGHSKGRGNGSHQQTPARPTDTVEQFVEYVDQESDRISRQLGLPRRRRD